MPSPLIQIRLATLRLAKIDPVCQGRSPQLRGADSSSSHQACDNSTRPPYVTKPTKRNALAIVVFSRHRERAFSTFAFIMKPNHARSRKPAAITNSRWLAYATASAASAFTCANSAEATIHYSGLIGEFFGSEDDKSARFQLDQPGDSIR